MRQFVRRLFGRNAERGRLMAALELRREPVEITGPNGNTLTVYVREMSLAKRLDYNQRMTAAADDSGNVDPQAFLGVFVSILPDVVVDAEGRPLLTADDVAELATKSEETMGQLVQASMRTSGITPEAAEEARRQIKKARSANSRMRSQRA